jgi:hypothetical protein
MRSRWVRCGMSVAIVLGVALVGALGNVGAQGFGDSRTKGWARTLQKHYSQRSDRVTNARARARQLQKQADAAGETATRQAQQLSRLYAATVPIVRRGGAEGARARSKYHAYAMATVTSLKRASEAYSQANNAWHMYVEKCASESPDPGLLAIAKREADPQAHRDYRLLKQFDALAADAERKLEIGRGR